MTPVDARFRDRRAAIVWFVALGWDVGVALLAFIVWSDGGGWKGWLALAVFALAGAAFSAFAARTPTVAVEVRSDAVAVTRRYPFTKQRQEWPLALVRGATVVEKDDAESPYYACRIELQRADPIDLYSKARREDAAAEAARFNAAARKTR